MKGPPSKELESKLDLLNGDRAGAGHGHPQCGLDHPRGPGAPGEGREDPPGPRPQRQVHTQHPQCYLG